MIPASSIVTTDKAGCLRGQQAKPSRAGDLASGDGMGHGYLTGLRDAATITPGWPALAHASLYMPLSFLRVIRAGPEMGKPASTW